MKSSTSIKTPRWLSGVIVSLSILLISVALGIGISIRILPRFHLRICCLPRRALIIFLITENILLRRRGRRNRSLNRSKRALKSPLLEPPAPSSSTGPSTGRRPRITGINNP